MANWLNDHASSDESELALVYLAMLQFKREKFCDWLVMSAMGAGLVDDSMYVIYSISTAAAKSLILLGSAYLMSPLSLTWAPSDD